MAVLLFSSSGQTPIYVFEFLLIMLQILINKCNLRKLKEFCYNKIVKKEMKKMPKDGKTSHVHALVGLIL